MLRYLGRRLLASIPVLLVASFITFWFVRISIDPLGEVPASFDDSQRVIAEQRKALGLNHSIVQQWWDWLTHFVRGDLGTSSRTGDSVSSMIGHALWPTVQLLFWATIVLARDRHCCSASTPR